MLLGKFCTKLRRKDTCKRETGLKFTSLDETNNDSVVGSVMFATSKNLDVESLVFPY
jgi:hypothetical protein